MATVLFTWELGGGLGHLMVLSPIAKALVANGHRVILATKDVLSAHQVLEGSGVELLGTPRSQFPLAFPQQFTFAHLLANVGFSDSSYLASHAGTWKTLYGLVQPDLIVFNHSPVALLAARGMPARRVILGSGFFVPPDVYPLPAYRTDLALDWSTIKSVEDDLLQRANQLLHSRRQPPLERLSQLYSQVDEIFLTTYRELDPFPNRGPTEYWGTVNEGGVGGKDPVWPNVPGKKIFAYLKNFPALPQLLQAISDSSQPALIYGQMLDPAIRDRFTSRTLRFENDRLNIAKVAAGCHIAITHAGPSTTAMILRAGNPVLLVPLTEEQGMLSRLVHQQGTGLGVLPDQPAEFAPRLKMILEDDRYRKAASKLAERLNQVDLTERQRGIIHRIKAILELPKPV